MAHAPAHPHDPLEEIFPDLFMVRGRMRMNALLVISRNMAIIRSNDELTLVNPIRLEREYESDLLKLGSIRRILRLGPMHGIDDPYYMDRFGAELWAQARSENHPERAPDVLVDASTPLPFPDGQLFCFEGTKQPESALRIARHGGVLFTCDSLQYYGDYRHNNWLARRVMPRIGFPKTMVVGPLWLKMMTAEGGSLENEFRRLLELEFDHFLSAHGSLLRGGAHAAVAAAVARAFPHSSGS